VLQLHESEIRRQAQKLNLYSVQEEDSWDTVAQATKIPVPLLQLYNPFLAPWPLQSGALVVYPPTIPRDVLEYKGKTLYYTSRLGDSYLHLAFVFGIDLEAFRRDNGLWRLQQLPIGQRLHMRVAADSAFLQLRPLLTAKTRRTHTSKGKRGRQSPVSAEAASADPSRTHRVRRGETLTQIARRYQTTVETLVELNDLQDPRVQAGIVLTLPVSPSAT
jgi:LysM repeat protein